MSGKVETLEFQSEARQVLDLMVHSVYSNRDIFLRELISNASDALDKLRFEALTHKDLAEKTGDLHVRIESDPEAGTLTVRDNGIGMSRDEVVRYIGTIAKSGSREFLNLLKQAQASDLPPELIGQFGVGFYSSFMVADKVTLVTRRAGEGTATKWESAGDGTFTLEEVEKEDIGTSVTLHLKSEGDDDAAEYLRDWKIREIVKRYSDYVAYPIRMKVERTELERDEEGKPKEGAEPKKVLEDVTLNSQKAIWLRAESEVPEEEYNEFYKHVSHDWTDPLKRILLKAEGTLEFRGLLFLPSKAPLDLYWREGLDRGIHLYIKRVFIMSDCKELIPEYLRFVRGVVDSEDLPLNISREILQKTRQIRVMRKQIVKKVLTALSEMKKEDAEAYRKFWGEFGRVLKEGLYQDEETRESLLDLGLFASTHDPEALTTLAEYVERMKPGQEKIYYMTGDSRKAAENSPHLEAFRDKGYEVLLLTDPVDEIWTQSVPEYREKGLQSAGKGTVDLGAEEEKKDREEKRREKEKEFKSLLEVLQSALDENVKEVRLSTRLTSSPVCLVGEAYDLSPHLEELLRSTGQEVPKAKRILEVNAGHPILEKLQGMFEADREDPRLREYAELLYGQALLAEGSPLPDPAGFSRRVAELMTKAM